MMKNLLKQFPWKDFVSIFLALMGIAISVANSNTWFQSTWTMISIALLSISSVFLVITLTKIIKDSHQRIIFFEDRVFLPGKYSNNKLLKYAAKNKLNLSVIGRTGISWFKDMDEQKKELYRNAIKKGCRIHFILQHKFVVNPNLPEEDVKVVKEHYDLVTEAFMKLQQELNTKNIKLSLTKESIENSMTKVFASEDDINYFLYDIGHNIAKKPAIVFKNNSVFQEIRNKFTQVESDAMDFYEYRDRISKAKKDIDSLIYSHHQHSSQRENDNKKLVYHYYNKRSGEKNRLVSIQLLITNTCSTHCVMCNHYKINSQNELTQPEIENILWYINDMGTKNVIISGGEPLNNENCLDILEYGKSKGLNLGLLTNGIKKDGYSITQNDARRIAKSCDWVQLSIDSFNPVTYKLIRNAELSLVLESLENLRREGANVEICFTIQQLNIEEAIQIMRDRKGSLTFGFPIRFKFAHGFDPDGKFLPRIEQIRAFREECINKDRHNSKYIDEMFYKRYFSVEDVAEGSPLKRRNMFFNQKKYYCHVLDYSCKIDSVGDIYPCCYLFDDNQGEKSELRSQHKIGSLRQDGSVRPFRETQTNILYDTLFNKKRLEMFKRERIPIQEKACNKCTRHFYQNEFLNELDVIATKNDDIKFVYELQEDCSKIWL